MELKTGSSPKYLGLSAPLCLENICRINLFFRLEEYPIQQLLLLPTTLRRDLSFCLSPADVLHFEAAGLFHDVDIAGVVEYARQKLLDVAFCNYQVLLHLFVPDILDFLVPEKCSPADEMPPAPHIVLKHICECCTSLPFTHNKAAQIGRQLIPNRISSFVLPIENMFQRIRSPALFLQYCHAMPLKSFSIDLYEFGECYLWSEFEEIYQELERKLPMGGYVKGDPVVPIIQLFVGYLQTFELGSNIGRLGDERDDTEEFVNERMQVTSYVLLYNIVTSEHPFLEHIKVYGECREIIEAVLISVKKIFADCGNNFPSSSNYVLQLDTPPAPYPLKSLYITNVDPPECRVPERDFLLDRKYASISSSTRSIVLCQLKSLEHVSIDLGTDFCYEYDRDKSLTSAERSYSIPENRELLSALADLLKQPQLQSLSVGRAPLAEAYQLVEVFLCTETTHSLSLSIEGVEEESKWIQAEYTKRFTIAFYDDDENMIDDSDCDKYIYVSQWFWMKEDELRDDEQLSSDHELNNDQQNGEEDSSHAAPATTRPPPAQPLPNSNGTLKSLDIGCSHDSLHTWLFSIPNLQLKELSTSRPDLVPSGVTFTVSDRYLF